MASSFVLPSRPTPLPIYKTCMFKKVRELPIHIDIYLPSPTTNLRSWPNSRQTSLRPVMLFIHGGGWTGSNRGDYSRPLFQHFLDAGFVVTSMDYRLVPESSNLQQLEDVKDVEQWLRKELPIEIGEKLAIHASRHLSTDGAEDSRKVVVVGASAGGQLGLLVPKLWKIQPSALLILYPPTNMHQLPYSGRGRLSALTLPPATHALLAEATDFEAPPSQRAIPKCALDYLGPRVVMTTHVFRGELIAELLLRGLKGDWEEVVGSYKQDKSTDSSSIQRQVLPINSKDNELRLPEKGSVRVEDIDQISPLSYLCSLSSNAQPSQPVKYLYPPTYLLTGTTDEVFTPANHTLPFYQELCQLGVPAEVQLVNGVGHAFDIWAEIGGWIGEDVLKGAVEWVEGWTR